MAASPEQGGEEPQPEAVTLEKLSEAFAEAFARGPGGSREGPDAERESAGQAAAPEDAAESDETAADMDDEGDGEPVEIEDADAKDDACPISPLSLLEAMLFVGSPNNEPLTPHQAAGLMRDVEPNEIAHLVELLNRRYDAGACPYEIVSDGPGYRLVLRSTYAPLQVRFRGQVRPARLSQAAIDVLAIAAYRQGVTADEVTRLRGRPSGHLLSQLVRRRLLRVERTETKPRTSRFYTTDRFLRLFRLKGLEDLPQSEDQPPP